ncbi:hypothetical protein BT96DRAFT_746139, partial [Gymnopus androsaceus JB14]
IKKTWTSPIYAFYKGNIEIEYHNEKLHHVFICSARGCGCRVLRNTTTKDAKSTKSLHTHVKKGWGDKTVDAATDLKSLAKAWELVRKHGKLKNSQFTDAFKSTGHDVYSHIPLTQAETQVEFVCWVSESLRPFNIALDQWSNHLMKTGCPECYVPHPSTVTHDTRYLFIKTRKCIAKKLR